MRGKQIEFRGTEATKNVCVANIITLRGGSPGGIRGRVSEVSGSGPPGGEGATLKIVYILDSSNFVLLLTNTYLISLSYYYMSFPFVPLINLYC